MAGIPMTIANSSSSTTDFVSGLFTQRSVALSNDNTGSERLQAHLMVCVYARDASGIRNIFAQSQAGWLAESLLTPRYFPVHAAVVAGNGAVLDALIRSLPVGALSVHDESDRTPLMCAAEHGQIAAIHKLLASQAPVDVTDQSGRTALMRAAASGAVGAVKVLLGYEVYADTHDEMQWVGIDKRDDNGDTSLMLAIRAGHHHVVEALVKRGANIHIANTQGQQALGLAVSLGRSRTVRLLCDQPDIDVNAVDHQGVTVVMHAAAYADQSYDPSILNLLLGRNGRTDLKDHSGCTALLRAAKGNSDIAIEHLIAGGADTHATDPEGRSALMLAAKHQNIYGLRFLLRQPGIWLEAQDQYGRTPLWYAIYADNYEIVTELVQCGANVNALDNAHNESLMGLALRRGHRQVVNLLRDNGADRVVRESVALAG